MDMGDLNAVLEAVLEVDTILLDEVQNVPGWEMFMNRLLRMDFNVFIIGSNANLLSTELATHLTGRHIPIELYPFSFREFLRLRKVRWGESTRKRAEIKGLLREHLRIGGFPEVDKRPDIAMGNLSRCTPFPTTPDYCPTTR